MFDIVTQVLAALHGAWRTQAALRELSLLSDHHLADLGLRREELATLERSAPRARKPRSVPRPAFRPELVPCG